MGPGLALSIAPQGEQGRVVHRVLGDERVESEFQQRQSEQQHEGIEQESGAASFSTDNGNNRIWRT